MATPKRPHKIGDLNWTDALCSVSLSQPEQVPSGWKTVEQISDEAGRSRSHTYRLIQDLFKSGKIERRDFRVAMNKRVAPVPHYKIL